MLCPRHPKLHREARVQHGEETLAHLVVEDGTQEAELAVGVAQAVTMRKHEHLVIYLHRDGRTMQHHATLLLEISVHPYIMVAGEIMHLDAHVRQLAYLPEEARISLWHYIFPFIPEVKHVAEKIDGFCLMLDRIKEADKAAFVHPRMGDSPRTEMGITEEIYFLHVCMIYSVDVIRLAVRWI